MDQKIFKFFILCFNFFIVFSSCIYNVRKHIKVKSRAILLFRQFFYRERWAGKGLSRDSEKPIRPEIFRMDSIGVMTFGKRVKQKEKDEDREREKRSEKLSTLHVSLMSLPSTFLCCSVASATPLSRQFDLSFPLFRLVTDTPASCCRFQPRE